MIQTIIHWNIVLDAESLNFKDGVKEGRHLVS